MKPSIEIVGVHPIQAPEPCFLLEMAVRNLVGEFDFGKITQESPNLASADWQVPWDERMICQDANEIRYAFFFHYLDLDTPLMTPFGNVKIPQPTPIPPLLKQIVYQHP